ncbi:MAG TPA: hypothetical protein DEV81_13655 [Cyanobacteria bacterium UBA11049]|nr:hypothetical protein [Cyanobacteria bacterium UBA11049]
MKEMIELQKQQDARLAEILALGRQHYLKAGGDPRRCPSGRYGNDSLTDEERKEALMLGRKLAGITVKDGYVHCQGRSWKLADSLANQQDKAISES